MGTAQSQYIDDVKFSSSKQSKTNAKVEAQRVAVYNEKLRREKRAGAGKGNSKRPNHDAITIAELMSYLKDVAAHASNLPLTIRDDPELGRTISSLTAREYAMKSKVFVPSDVRVIGCTSLNYKTQVEYPNKRDLKLSEKVTEFSLSQGGACCNAMLKVLYDSGNEDGDMMEQHDFSNTDNLFDESDNDDDDDDDASIGSIVFNDSDVQSGSKLTWASMLRKMKDEMVELGHKQVPTISASRRFELDEPFSLIPDSFDSTKNKKIALLIGCNYMNSSCEIPTSHNDIRSMKDYIVNIHGFSEDKDSLTILLDDGKHSAPTQKNIIKAFETIAKKSKKGDAVLIQFAGHGTRVLDTSVGVESDCYEEVIFPSDFEKVGPIRDTTIFTSLLAPMAKDVTVTILLDSSDTGIMLDMPYSWSTIHDNTDVLAKLSLNGDFSFVRVLNVLKQMYETSAYCADSLSRSNDNALGYDSDSLGNESLCTISDDDNDESVKDDYDNDDIDSFDDGSVHDKTAGKLDNSMVNNEESMMTTIGGYFTPAPALQKKSGSRKPRVGLQKKGGSMNPSTSLQKEEGSLNNRIDGRDPDNSNRGDNAGSYFSANSFTSNLSDQNLFTQVYSALTHNTESEGKKEITKTNAPHSAAYYDDNGNTDYFAEDSSSDDSLGSSRNPYA